MRERAGSYPHLTGEEGTLTPQPPPRSFRGWILALSPGISFHRPPKLSPVSLALSSLGRQDWEPGRSGGRRRGGDHHLAPPRALVCAWSRPAPGPALRPGVRLAPPRAHVSVRPQVAGRFLVPAQLCPPSVSNPARRLRRLRGSEGQLAGGRRGRRIKERNQRPPHLQVSTLLKEPAEFCIPLPSRSVFVLQRDSLSCLP